MPYCRAGDWRLCTDCHDYPGSGGDPGGSGSAGEDFWGAGGLWYAEGEKGVKQAPEGEEKM